MIEAIKVKLQNKEPLTEGEVTEFIAHITVNAEKLKAESPEEYLKVLETLNAAIVELNTSLKEVL